MEGSSTCPDVQIETLNLFTQDISQFLAADVCLISSPIWNFSIPYALKYYIDAIVQPGYLFSFKDGVPPDFPRGIVLDEGLTHVLSATTYSFQT
jgi:FMN-dependent NADH-azoreductase